MILCSLLMFMTLFLMMDAIGNIPSFLEVLKNVNAKRYWWVVCREMGVALLLMLFFNYLGPYLIQAIEASETTVLITSGLILLIGALGVVYPSEKSIRLQIEPGKEPFILPLATPLIAGPALLATIALYGITEPCQMCRLQGIFFAWGLSFIILLSGRFLQKLLTDNGLLALERLLSLVLVMLGTQRIVEGIKLFFKSYVNHS